MKITKSLLKRIIKDEIHKINENNPSDSQIDDKTMDKTIDEKIKTLKAMSKGSVTRASFLISELDRLLDELSEMADVRPRT